ncbi:hypothetical protein ACE7GA_16505 [Roseomonas sp. CCTCC AB2023176]|uniref:hypothetical protein n=1 Tax=Roseomonas sp. CCTCC AB2023176 TaxID=3342640 RepID=UPI0035E32DF9
MLGAIPAALGALDPGPRVLVVPGALGSGLAFSRASTALGLGADGASWASAAANLPRFHGTARRLLIEGSRTNGIRNPLSEGTVAGTPGTTPTNWVVSSSANGIARQVVGTGVESGVAYVDIRYSGTATASGTISIAPEGNTAVAAAVGQTWTASFFTRVAGGSLSGLTTTLMIRERDTAAASLGTGSVAVSPGSSLATSRQTLTRQLNQAACAFVQSSLNLAYASGAVLDVTLRIGQPGLELGAFASSPIAPPAGAPAAATRAADAASLSLSGAVAAQGTLVLRALLPQLAASSLDQGLLQLDDGTDTNRLVLRNTAGGGRSRRS